MRKRFKIMFALALAIFLLFPLPFSFAAETLIRVGVPASQTSAIPIHIGARKGIFAKYGLRVEPIVIPNGRVNINALISGNTEFINGSSPELFFVGEQGGDIIGVGCWDNSSPYNLVSRQKIQSLKELKGKRLAAGGFMDKSHLFLKLLLSKEGLDAGKGVELIFIGGSSARLGMLASGKIDAAPAAPEFGKRAEKLSLFTIPVSMPYAKGLITTRKSFLENNRPTVKTYLKAYMESVDYLMKNKEESIQIIAQVFKLQDREALDYAYNVLRSNAQPDLQPSEEAIRNVLRTMAYEETRFATVPPFKHLDLSLVGELRASREVRAR